MTTQGARLAGLAAVITGANRGIGATLAKGLAREGAAVVVNYPDAATEPEARAVAEEICGSGGRAIAVRADVRALAEHRALIAAAQGEFEPFKTSSIFDGTAKHPEWLGDEPPRIEQLMPA